MRILKNPVRSETSATVAQVTFSDIDSFGAVGASERRGMPVFAPRGVAYRPCEGDNLLLLPVDGVDTCAGVLAHTDKPLAEGELHLCSAGGASILLAKNGDVVINGVTITKAGKLVPAGEGA